MGGLFSSNPHAVFFEIDNVLTKYENRGNSLEIDIGSPGETAINGCRFITDDSPSAAERGTIRPWTGGNGMINLHGIQVNGPCGDQSDKFLDNENYFSKCFLVPKNLRINDNNGMNISDKCKLVYKIEIKCEGDDTEEDTGETVEEPFTNFKNDNDKSCIFLAAIIVVVYLYIKRKN